MIDSTDTTQKVFQSFVTLDSLFASINDFMRLIQDMSIPSLKGVDKITLVGQWSMHLGESPIGKISEKLILSASSPESWMKVSQVSIKEIKDIQDLTQSLLLKIPDQFRSREAEYIDRIEQKDYPFFISEVGKISTDNLQLAYDTADLLEKAMNVAKIRESDPLESRKIEDFQWSLIEAKRILIELSSCQGEYAKQKKSKLEEVVQDLQNKILACEKTKRTLRELGLEGVTKELVTEKLPNGRVRLVWRKSG